MLCVKEGTFEEVLDQKDFKVFKNANHYTGIIFDQAAIPVFKKAIKILKVNLASMFFLWAMKLLTMNLRYKAKGPIIAYTRSNFEGV
jgi:type II restriction/modification system DNA methylase subunit YeeA